MMSQNQKKSSTTGRKATSQIVAIYTIVIVLMVTMIIYFLGLGERSEQRAKDLAANGVAQVRLNMKATVAKSIGKHVLGSVTGDLQALNQLGEKVSIQSLKGKVWVFAQFYGSCPECNSTNLGVLKKLHDKYKDHDNFQIVTISIKASEDAVTLMKKMADSYKVDASDWWFLSADIDAVNKFCQEEMGYMKFGKSRIKSNPGPEDMLGEIYHDMGISVFDPEMNMWAKVDLFRPMKTHDKLGTELAIDKLFLTVDWCLEKLKIDKQTKP